MAQRARNPQRVEVVNMNKSVDFSASERGVVLVQVAIAILVLVGFLVFVLDYGVLWIARAQAQNSADAGALAGAIARAFDDFAVPPSPISKEIAQKGALANSVWNASAGDQYVDVFIDDPAKCPAGYPSCVRVEVFRNEQHGKMLPTYFGPIFNITEQGVRATATAIYANANATDCMRPFSIPDRWYEKYPAPGKPAPGPTDEYNHWYIEPPKTLKSVTGPDEYSPPTETGVGSGYRYPEDVGVKWTLSAGSPSQSDVAKTRPGWFFPVALPDGKGGYVDGKNDWPETIGGCVGNPVTIGEYLPIMPGLGAGPIDQGMDVLIAKDKDAYWKEASPPSAGEIIGSCADKPTPCASFSPRIVPLSVFDIEEFQSRTMTKDWSSTYYDKTRCALGCTPPAVCSGSGCVRVVNILGFFVNNKTFNPGDDIVGYLKSDPGEFVKGKPSVGAGSSFLKVIQLVR
jgi:hypothetical protein